MADELPKWRQLEPWLQLFHIPGVGINRYLALLKAFHHPEQVLSASLTRLRTLVPERVAKAIVTCHRNTLVNVALTRDKQWLLNSINHQIITLDSTSYPALLKTIYDPPPVLYINGCIEALSRNQVAVVGSRNPSLSAKTHARNISWDLAESGLTVTSGLARGIDGAAHLGALEAGGSTVAVMASGVDIVYPVRHKSLAARIKNSGALVSEFPLGTQPKAGHFPRRNRIISGLSTGVLVIEAAVASGSLVTARCALEQGREVLAMPGVVSNPGVRGCHALIREGAVLVENAEQVIREVEGVMVCTSPAAQALSEPVVVPSSPDQQQVLSLIGSDTCHQDELIIGTGMDSRKVAEILLTLELDGFVKTVPGGVVRIYHSG